MWPDLLSTALRAFAFVALLQAAGLAVFVSLFQAYLQDPSSDFRRLATRSALLAAFSLVAQYLLEAARMGGSMGATFDPSLQRLALASFAAVVLATRLAGLAVIVIGLKGTGRGSLAMRWAGFALIVGSFALIGHTAVHSWRWALAPTLVAHVGIASFWVGALPALYGATVRWPGASASGLIEAFSRRAVWLVPWIAAAGLLMAVAIVPDFSAFARPYGWLLLVKAGGFALLMFVAALNRRKWGPAVARGQTRAFARSLIVEYVLIATVLAATATMTNLYSPDP